MDANVTLILEGTLSPGKKKKKKKKKSPLKPTSLKKISQSRVKTILVTDFIHLNCSTDAAIRQNSEQQLLNAAEVDFVCNPSFYLANCLKLEKFLRILTFSSSCYSQFRPDISQLSAKNLQMKIQHLTSELPLVWH